MLLPMNTAKRTRRVTPTLMGKRDRAQAEARRRRALRLISQGKNQSEVADIVGVTRQAVSKWVRSHRSGGAQALASKGKPGRKTAPSAVQRRRILVALRKGAVANGYQNELWNLRRISLVVSAITGRPPVSLVQTWRLLRELGWSCQRPERRARQQDPKAVKEFRAKTWEELKKRQTLRETDHLCRRVRPERATVHPAHMGQERGDAHHHAFAELE